MTTDGLVSQEPVSSGWGHGNSFTLGSAGNVVMLSEDTRNIFEASTPQVSEFMNKTENT